jgi:sialic acid synthase SpsE
MSDRKPMTAPSFHSPRLAGFAESFEIAGRKVGGGAPSYVIAEAGSNHNKDLKTALALVDAAADAGCDSVKFQTFVAEEIGSNFRSKETEIPPNLRKWGTTLQELYRNCALPDEFHEPIAARAAERKIAFFSSAFSERDVDRLMKVGVPAIKIASFELVHLPLIRHAANTGLPLIVSTGMAGLGDIERALEAVAAGGGGKVALLHCGSSYPLNAASANLAAMETMRRAFAVPVGYSDHTLGVAVPAAAAALGAAALEKHFTLDRKDEKGPDHSFAVEPQELKEMVKLMREAEQAIGTARKSRATEEEPLVRLGRRSLFVTRDLRAGEKISHDSVKVLRPGIGIDPMFLPLLLGRPVRREMQADTPLTWDDVLDGPR